MNDNQQNPFETHLLRAMRNADAYMDAEETDRFYSEMEKWIADYMKKRALDDLDKQLTAYFDRLHARMEERHREALANQ